MGSQLRQRLSPTKWHVSRLGVVGFALILVGCGTLGRLGATPSPAVSTFVPVRPTQPPSRASSISPPPPTIPSPTTSAPPSIPTPFSIAVGNTGGDGVFIRSAPGTGDRIKAWPDGTAMTVIGQDQTVAGQSWKNVKDPDGNSGWVASQFLVVAKATRPAASTPSAAGAPAELPTSASPTLVPTKISTPTVTPVPVTVAFVGVVGGHPGQSVSVTAQTTAGANCGILYVVPHGTETSAAGLEPKTADSTGRVRWSWTVDPATPTGPGVVTVTCAGASATTEIPIS